MTESRAPRPKVLASTAGTGVGVTVGAFIVGLLDDLVYRSGSVPDYVVGLVMTLVPVGLAFLAGYVQRDTSSGGDHRA